MATIKVHGNPISTATMRVTASLYEKELDFEFVLINMKDGEHKNEPFISRNPFGQVPAFEDGDLKLFESRAITKYTVHEYPNKGTKLVTNDTKRMAIIDLWIEIESHHFDPPAMKLVWEWGIKPIYGIPIDPKSVQENESKLSSVLEFYEKRVS